MDSLIAQAAQNDPEAFAQLVSVYQDQVYTLSLRLSGSEETALDLSLDSFLKAWHAVSLYRSDCSFSVWLARIVCQTGADELKKRGRNRPHTEEPAPGDIPVNAQGAARISASDSQTVLDALQSLPIEERAAVSLCEGLSFEDAAAILDCGDAVLQTRLRTAAERLRRTLGGSAEEAAETSVAAADADRILRSLAGADEEDSALCPSGSSAGCQILLEQYRAVRQALKNASAAAPETLSDAVLRSIRREQERYSPRQWLRRWRFTAAAVVIIAAVVLIARFGNFSRGGTAGQEETAVQTEETVQPMTSAEFHAAAAPAEQEQTAPSLRELLLEAGCSGTVYVVSGMTDEELQEMLPCEAVELPGGDVSVFRVDADAAEKQMARGSLTAEETFSVGAGDDVFVVLR